MRLIAASSDFASALFDLANLPRKRTTRPWKITPKITRKSIDVSGGLTENGAVMNKPFTPALRRTCDVMPTALVFGGLLIVLAAAGGTLDLNPARLPLHFSEEIKVAVNEGVHRVDGLDPLTACKKMSHSSSLKGLELARRCRQNR